MTLNATITDGFNSTPVSPTAFYTTTQLNAIIWTPRFSGSLSVIGSGLIIMMILQRGRERLTRIHNRLILGMSILDVLNSIALGSSTAPFPSELREIIPGAVGNHTTCVLQGFLIIFGLSVPMYNAMLCLYYLAIIKYNTKDDILERYEPFMHVFATVIPLSGAIFGASFGLIYPRSKGYCWFADGCEFEGPDCQPRPKVSLSITKYLILALAAITNIIIVYSMGSIYWFVRDQAITMKKYQSFKGRNSIHGGDNKKGTHEETLTQATLYIAAYFCTCSVPFINTFIENLSFTSIFLRCLLFPLQGFWNFIIFVRPKYVALKEQKKDKTFSWLMKAVVFRIDTSDSSPKEDDKGSPMAKNNAARRRASRLEILERSKTNGGGKDKQRDITERRRISTMNYQDSSGSRESSGVSDMNAKVVHVVSRESKETGEESKEELKPDYFDERFDNVESEYVQRIESNVKHYEPLQKYDVDDESYKDSTQAHLDDGQISTSSYDIENPPSSLKLTKSEHVENYNEECDDQHSQEERLFEKCDDHRLSRLHMSSADEKVYRSDSNYTRLSSDTPTSLLMSDEGIVEGTVSEPPLRLERDSDCQSYPSKDHSMHGNMESSSKEVVYQLDSDLSRMKKICIPQGHLHEEDGSYQNNDIEI